MVSKTERTGPRPAAASQSRSGSERPHPDLAGRAARDTRGMLDEQRAVAVDPARHPLDRHSSRQRAHRPQDVPAELELLQVRDLATALQLAGLGSREAVQS